MLNATVTELSAALAARKISSVELARQCLERIRALEELNAFIRVDESLSLEAARRADHAFRSALASRIGELLRGQGFTRCRVNCSAKEDDEGFHEQRYVVEAFDSGAHYELTVERPTRPDLGIEHNKVFLFAFADRIALELLKAREARRPKRVTEVTVS